MMMTASQEEVPQLDIVLASASPRRKQLLEDAGVAFRVMSADVDETLEPSEAAQPEEAAKKLAERKAGAVTQIVLADQEYRGTCVVIGADTMVVLDDVIFGKPTSVDDAKRMLRSLSGRTHRVVTAVSVWVVLVPPDGKVSLGMRSFVDAADVTFKQLDERAISDYLLCGESFDKAGAYAIQGEGRKLVERYDGSWDTIVGLPVDRLLESFPELRGV